MLDLHYLKTFMVVVETSSFTAAAARLGCSQSTVTFHIKAIEREFGAVLFERHRFGKSVVVTNVGRTAYDYASQLCALAEEARQAVQRTLSA